MTKQTFPASWPDPCGHPEFVGLHNPSSLIAGCGGKQCPTTSRGLLHLYFTLPYFTSTFTLAFTFAFTSLHFHLRLCLRFHFCLTSVLLSLSPNFAFTFAFTFTLLPPSAFPSPPLSPSVSLSLSLLLPLYFTFTLFPSLLCFVLFYFFHIFKINCR